VIHGGEVKKKKLKRNPCVGQCTMLLHMVRGIKPNDGIILYNIIYYCDKNITRLRCVPARFLVTKEWVLIGSCR